MMQRRTVVSRMAAVMIAATTALPLIPAAAVAADDIKIGDLNSYSSFSGFAGPYRKGWQLRIEEINAAGGLLGRQLSAASRDDGANTGDAVRMAEELVSSEKVDLLFGTMLSNTGLAITDFAGQKEIFFLAAEPLTDALTLEKGNKFTFRVRPSTWTQTAMLVEEAKSLGKKRWAIVAPNYEYGQSAAEAFKALLKTEMPDAEIVAEQYPALGKINAGATVQALMLEKPDAIFNVLFGNDLAKFVREGDNRGLFEDRTVVSLLTGEPEWISILNDEAPEGWIVTGYPWYDLDEPAHAAFRDAYIKRWEDTPRLGSLVGYIGMSMIAEAIKKAGSVETPALIEAMKGLEIDTPLGKITMRPEDNQSTMGAFVGKTALRDDAGVMVDWHYESGSDFMIPAEEAAKRRAAE